MYNIKLFYKNEVIRNSFIYIVTSIINASIPFLLLPILTSCLTPADYGITALYQLVVSFMIPLIGLNSEGAVSVEYYRGDSQNFGLYVGNCVLLSFISLSFFLLIAFLFSSILEETLEIPSRWILLAVLHCFFQFISLLTLVLWQVSKKSLKFGIYQITTSLFNALLSIWFVYYLNGGYTGRLNAYILSAFFSFLFCILYIYHKYGILFSFDIKVIKDILSYGIPLIPHAIGGWGLALVDRFILANKIGLGEVGRYSVAFQLASVLGIITIAVNQAFVPWLYSKLTAISYEQKKKIVRMSYFYMIGLVLLSLVMIIGFPLIQKILVNDKFDGVSPYFSILIWGFCFQGFYFVFTNYISFVKKTRYQAVVTISITIIKIPLTYFFISLFGGIGAAIAYSLIYFLFFFITAIVSNKLYCMPWNLFTKITI